MSYSRTIGLLGGSFNPAHSGHVQLSREALKRLKLDAVWWLVSPQNPLKDTRETAPYETRLAGAKALLAKEKHIHATALERELGTRYTADTLRALRQRFPRVQFVWLMGADNLAQFHRWRRWPEIMSAAPIAVFDRAPFSHKSLRGKAAVRFAKARVPERRLKTHGWCYVSMRKNPENSTDIRKMLEKKQDMRHN